MLEGTFEIFTYLLAIYGALSLISCIVNTVRQRVIPENSKVKMVLVVKNQEDTVEGIIRNVFTGDFLRKIMSEEKLAVVDMSSSDKTIDILKKLRDEYLYMDVLTLDEKDKIFECFKEDV